eukprot:TRINITY_DN944_c0_g1_i4.p1 TRINITY_DN944_c0_g1~~TRINITY_DN944_c0_g1_i4.p1  ORF type:complete len:488 (-),score=68.35 TRINITY_DN944_c0_g1_i4:91-1416(-)
MKTDSSLTRLSSSLQGKLSSSVLNNLKMNSGVLSVYNLKGIEASLLALGAQNSQRDGSGPSSDLTAFLLQIADLIGQMKNQIRDQKTSSQMSLDNAVSDLSNCSLNSNTSSLSFWNTRHMECRSSESTLGALYSSCLGNLAQDDQTVYTRYQTFQAVNTWPSSCAYQRSSTASIGSSDRRRSNRNYLIEVRDSFRSRLDSWTTAYANFVNASAARNLTRADCITKLFAYRRETTRCNAIQNDLETHACGGSQSCDSYMDCYKCNHDQWLKTNTTIASSETAWLSEWQGILRIECLIAQINSTSAFNAAACNTDYSGSLSDEVRIRYASTANIPGLVSCASTSASGQIPGSASFIQAYYGSMPAHTKPAACKASCCVYRDGCCYSFKYESNLACCLETANSNLANCSSQSGYGSTTGWVSGKCPTDADSAYAIVGSTQSSTR